ncbi:hypothetical protein [Nocardia implantans]|uniref:Uncharacterized protein n=1 Tax=Nocardia implantans TaxID=3108168 RepID=A0ABU6ASW1_9NOCA|nr:MULTISPECIES: hypothetical protein [unclassified Nocardia]MBF6190915.1 hypothetical protein [Nocardia beijingensis]MEA3528906.1 hypothetical protein [Nocardia sp. CDC192]MEB3510571.1 hypothetical protein [Nocardia sp. CDC186]
MRDTTVDRLLNTLFGWGALSLLLYRCDMTPGIASLARQLSLGCTVMASMCQGIVRVRAFDADPAAARRGHRACRVLAAGSTAAILLAGAQARRTARTRPVWPSARAAAGERVPLAGGVG